MSTLGQLYRHAKAWAEPDVYPRGREVPFKGALDGRRIVVLGDEALTATVTALLATSGCETARAMDDSGVSGDYDGAVVCAALPPLIVDSASSLQMNEDAMEGLRSLYFANQAACNCLHGSGCSLVDVVISDGSVFWQREIDGLTKGIASAMVTSNTPVNAIHLFRGETTQPDGRVRAAVAGLGDLITLWLSDAGTMSSGNVIDVDCEVTE